MDDPGEAMSSVQALKLFVKKNAAREAAKKYRDGKKNDDEFLKKERERKKVQRQILKEKLKECPEEKIRLKELNRIRQIRYRERKKAATDTEKEEHTNKIPPRLTRAEHERKKQYWREKKRAQRANMTSQKKRRIKEYDRKRKRKTSPTNNKQSVESEITPTTISTSLFTKNTVKQRAFRVKKNLPKSPTKFAQVVSHLVKNATPKKRKSLKEMGLSDSPLRSKDRGVSTLSNLRENLQTKSKNKNWPLVKRCIALGLRSVKRAVNYKTIARETGMNYKFLRKYTNVSKMSTTNEESFGALLKRKTRSDAMVSNNSVLRKEVQDHFTSCASFVPDKKAVDKKTLEPKKVLQESISSIYEDFKAKNPNMKISRSKFHELRPKNVQTTCHQKLYQSRCEYCTNPEIKLAVLNKLCDKKGTPQCKIKDNYKLTDITLCPKQNEKYHKMQCITRKCHECDVSKLVNHLKDLVTKVGDEVIQWNYWTSKKYNRPGKAPSTRKVVEKKNGTIMALVEDLEKEVKDLPRHLFVANWQKTQFNNLSKRPPADSIVIHMDFSENYSTFYQQEVSSAHWMKNLVTVHPSVVFYNCPDCATEGSTSPVMDVLVFLSDDTKHDHHAVQAFMEKTVAFLKDERKVQFSKICEFTDGCSSQYKSRGPLVDLSFGKEDFDVVRERSFFGSCHGKGPSDGAGAVTKTAARRSVIRDKAVITDARSMFSYLEENFTRNDKINNKCNHSRRKYFLIDNINRNRNRNCSTTLKGTRQIHTAQGISPGLISTRNLACFCKNCEDSTLCENDAYVTQWEVRQLKLDRTTHRPLPSMSFSSDSDNLVEDIEAIDAQTVTEAADHIRGSPKHRCMGSRGGRRGRKRQNRADIDNSPDLVQRTRGQGAHLHGGRRGRKRLYPSTTESSSDSDSPNYMTKRGNIRGRGVRTRGGKIGGHGVRIRGGKVCSSLNEVNTSESEEDILEISGLSNILNELEKEEDQEMSPVFPVFDDVILPIIPGLFETEDVPLDPAIKDQPQSLLEDQPQSTVEDQPQSLLEDQPQSTVEDQPQSLLEDQPQSTVEDQPHSLLEDQAQSTVEDQPQSAVVDQSHSLLEDQPQSLLEDQPQSLLEDQPQSLLEDQPQSQLEDQPQSTVEDQPQSLLEDQPQSTVEDQPQSLLEDQPQSAVVDQPPSLLEYQAQSTVEDQSHSLLEDQPQSLLEDQPQSLLEDQPQSLLEDQPQSAVEEQRQSVMTEDSEDQPITGDQLIDQAVLGTQSVQRKRFTRGHLYGFSTEYVVVGLIARSCILWLQRRLSGLWSLQIL